MTKVSSQCFAPRENAKATEASYRASLLIAKTGKHHSIVENLVKPTGKVMTNILLGRKARAEINRVPLSNDSVWQITTMAENVQNQLKLRK